MLLTLLTCYVASTFCNISISGQARLENSWLSPILSAQGDGPISISFVDSQGRRTGYDPSVGQGVVEIPGSTYNGLGSNPQLVTISAPYGEYLVETHGAAEGYYRLEIVSAALEYRHVDASVSNIRLNETVKYYLRLRTDGSVFIFDCSADLNDDYAVDVFDALVLAGAYGSTPSMSIWRVKADINNDDVVDLYDAIRLAKHYGKQWIEFQTVARGYFSGITSSGYYVIDDQENWTNLWNQHQSIRTPQDPLPEVNFSESIIVAVFMGTRVTGGFEIEVKSVQPSDNLLVVKVESTRPGLHCIVVFVLTQPYHIIKLDRTDRQIFFDTTQTIRDCG